MTRPNPTARPRRSRRSPRRVVNLRIQADSEAECLAACAQITTALPGCTLCKPRPGNNPRYADHQKWFSYGRLEL